MKVTRGQLRKIIREELERMGDLHVVIGNAGRGRQLLWPSSDEPSALSRAEAERIVDELNAKQGRGYSQIHYHAKPIGSALEYVAAGQRATAGLHKLIEKLGNS